MRSVPSINCSFAWRTCLLFSIFSLPYILFSQPTGAQLKKFSPVLQSQWRLRIPEANSLFVVAVNNFSVFKSDMEKNPRVRIVFEYKAANVFLVRTSWNEILTSVLSRKDVLFVDEQRKAREELAVSNLDLSADKVNVVFSKFAGYNGNGIVVSVKENRPDTSDIDFKGRYLSTDMS